jgi:hypothetical protein
MARLLHTKLPFVDVLSAAWHGLRRRLAEPYRPEAHYMRGPGPKARAKREG